MRKAKKEGRLMGNAPFGYINRSHEDGKKYIAIKEPEASSIIWAFNEVAKGHMPAEHVRIQMNKKRWENHFKKCFCKGNEKSSVCRENIY